MLRTSILAVAALLVSAPAAGAATLDQTVEAWLAGSQVGGSHTSLMVFDRTTGRLLVVHDATTELRPASNMKLLTSAAVLQRFGVGTHLTTRVMTGGTLAGGTLTGNLWLVGGGDPSLSTNTFSINSWGGVSGRLADLAAAVHAAGIRRVTGRLYGDEARFDRVRSGPYWKSPWWRDCPPLSALSVNEDLFAFGQPQASPNPPLFAAQHFVSSLRAQGTVFRFGPSTGTHPATARVVASEASPALTRLVRQMDQRSDNYYAEVLAKNLAVHGGLAGTTANGVRAIRNAVGDIGVVLSGARIYDGSGLSLGDRLSSRDIVAVLNHAAAQRWSWYFRYALPLAGVSGTLRDRMTSGPAYRNVQAKTGTLDDASALSGYVTAANGHRLLFAMVMNHPGIDVLAAHRLQDRICQLLAASRPT